MESEKDFLPPGRDAQEQSDPREQELINKVQQIADEMQVELKESDAKKIAAEIPEKKRLVASMEKDTGQERSFSEDDYIKKRIEEIKEGEEFLKTYLDALEVFGEVCPDGTFFSFRIDDPYESLKYTKKVQPKEKAKFFFSTIAHRLKKLRETFGAPIERGTRCFVIEDYYADIPYVKERAISKIDKKGKVTFIGEQGTYSRGLFKSAEDAMWDIREHHPRGKELKEIKIERLPE